MRHYHFAWLIAAMAGAFTAYEILEWREAGIAARTPSQVKS